MKKLLYVALLAAELFVGTTLMMALWNSSLYIPIAVAAVALVGLQTWQLTALFKANDALAKRKILRRIALIMLTPIAVFALTYTVIATAFVLAFILEGF